MTDDRRRAVAAATFDVVDEGILVLAVDEDAGFPVVDANASAARITGRDRDAIVGSRLDELQPPRVVAGFARRAREVLRSGVPQHEQIVDEGPAGRTTLDVSLCPVPELGDDPPHVAAVFRDVTVLLRVADTLDEVERVTRTGTWSWEIGTDTVRWSSQLYTLFGVARADLKPSFEGYLDRIHPDDRDEVQAAIGHTLESGEPFVLRHRVVTPEDEVRWLHCTGRRVAGLDGHPVRMSGTAQLVDDGDGATGD